MLTKFLSLFIHGPISPSMRRFFGGVIVLLILSAGGFAFWCYWGLEHDPVAGSKPTRSWNGSIKVVDEALHKSPYRDTIKIDDVSEVTLVEHKGTMCWRVAYSYHYLRECTVGDNEHVVLEKESRHQTFFIQNDVIVDEE